MRSIRVGDVHQVHGMASASVPEDALLEDVVSMFAHEPGLRSVFLVDSKERFSGLITRIAMLKWAQFQLVGGSERFISSRDIFSLVAATKAKDLARGDRRTLGVKESDSLQTALGQMVDLGEDVLPVLDENGHIVGDIRLSEVISKAIEVGKLARDKEH
jgi:CBS-domain-containing membrane protein